MSNLANLPQPLPEGLADARALVYRAWSEALAPDPELLVSQWADAHRQLSTKASAEAGQWSTSRTPFMREFMDAMSLSHPSQDNDLMKGTQIGGSEAIYNAIGYTIDQVACPIMLVMPTTDTAKRVSKQRLQPMIEETAPLAAKIRESRSRDSGNTLLMKDYPGGTLILAGANSGPGLRSNPIRVLVMDEIDAYPDDVDGEGDPCAVAEKRTDQFGARAKRSCCSSPKIKGSSRIDRRYNRGSRAKYHVPCPHCGELQWLKWAQMRWEMEKCRELACSGCGAITEIIASMPEHCPHCEAPAKLEDVRERPTEDVANAWYECERCTQRIDEHHKTAMMDEWPAGRARHIHEAPGIGEVLDADDRHPHAIWAWIGGKVTRYLPRFRRPLSWHVSALYSPIGWFAWRKAVVQFLEAGKGGYDEESGESLMQVFYNTVLGEAYEIPGEQPEQDMLKLRAEPYQLGQVPAFALLLTAAVDVQGDRIEVKVKGYGRGQESALVDYQRIYYPVGAKKPTEQTWAELLKIRDKGYPHAGGQTLRITAMAIDSGYLQDEVTGFTRIWQRSKHILATKGLAFSRGKPILGLPVLVDVSHRGKKIKRGAQQWPIGVDTGKELVYSRLGIAEPGPGYMHFPRGLPDEYFEQLTAEKLIRRRVKNVEKIEWVKTRERNEALDLEILCQAAGIYAGLQRVNWDQLEKVLNPNQQDLFAQPQPAGEQAVTELPAGEAVDGDPSLSPSTAEAATDPPVRTSAPGEPAASGLFHARRPGRGNWVTGFRA